MRLFINVLISFISFSPIFGQHPLFQSGSWQEAVKKADQENKLIFVEVCSTDADNISDTIQASDVLLDLHTSNFINVRLTPSNAAYSSVVSNYQVNSFPAYLYLNKSTLLLLPAVKTNSTENLLINTRSAIAQQHEKSPLAQMDLDFSQQKLSKVALYDYIQKRTALGFDNADIIDAYAQKSSLSDLLTKPKLALFLQQNNCNADGYFLSVIDKEKEKVMLVLGINELAFYRLITTSFTYTFDKICKNRDEDALNALIAIKIKNSSNEDAGIIKNELLAKYYYQTKQPLKLANFATAYADAIIKYNESIKTKKVKTPAAKSLFPSASSQGSTEASNEIYALKLRDAAQYMAETLTNKNLLNLALTWSLKATEMFNCFSGYETQAYILYKLGKRTEAIHCMEKATTLVPSQDDSQMRDLSVRLVKMKRGERIF